MDKALRRQLEHQAWSCIESGQFEKAIEANTLLFADNQIPPRLYNRGKAYLLMGNYTAAFGDFSQAATLSGPKSRIDSHSIMQGICFWYLNQPAEAIAMWREALTANYTDAAGGVIPPAILLYAGERLNDDRLKREALNIFKKKWRNHQKRVIRRQAPGYKPTHDDFVHPGLFAWPGAILPFLLEEISTEQLFAAAAKSFGGKTDRGLAQADFHFALRALREGNRPAFREGMTRCTQRQDALLEDEYFLAKWEVEQNFPEPAFP